MGRSIKEIDSYSSPRTAAVSSRCNRPTTISGKKTPIFGAFSLMLDLRISETYILAFSIPLNRRDAGDLPLFPHLSTMF